MRIPVIPAGIRNLEPAAWLGMRISGLVLFLLAGWYAVQVDVLTGLDHVNSSWLAARWANPLWQVFDFLLVFLVTMHGLMGCAGYCSIPFTCTRSGRGRVNFPPACGRNFYLLSGIVIFTAG